MSSRGETREQPSIPDPPELRIEHAGLAVTLVALTVALGALAVESVTHVELLRRGAYSVLAALVVVGVVTYFGVRVLRELAVIRAQRIEVRQMLQYREMMRRRAVGEPVGAGQHRSSRGGDQFYWTVYSDVLEDLGGLDGPPSGN